MLGSNLKQSVVFPMKVQRNTMPHCSAWLPDTSGLVVLQERLGEIHETIASSIGVGVGHAAWVKLRPGETAPWILKRGDH